MEVYIDPTAKVHKSALIRPGVWIGPNVTIEEGVVIGHGSVIGGPPEHRDFYDDIHMERSRGVIVKAGARIFEYVTVHAGTVHPTEIGENVAVFNKSHIGHDCILDKGCVIGGQVSIAGHAYVMRGANVSGKSCLVQFCVVGAYGFVGGFTYLTKHLPPGERWVGMPPRFIGRNDVGLQRACLTYDECIQQYKTEFDRLTMGRKI